ncbi:glycerol acyltransferase [Bacteroidia bacterium]|nr:glycerol acyltransferase [Bacteroidia bacterium]
MKTTLEITEKPVDIKRFIGEKNAKLARRIPWFIYSWLNKILHVDELNAMLVHNKDAWGVDFATALIHDFKITMNVHGIENIHPEDRCIIIANHPLGGMDGVALISSVGQVHKNIVFPVNDILYALTNLHPVFTRVNKYGNNRDNVKNLLDVFNSERTVLYFPAGLCSRRQKDGSICDLEWKPTFVAQAQRTKRNVIPVFIDAHNSKKFYNLAYWRKKLGLKNFNIEQLYLVDEGFKFANKTITLTIGKPIPYTIFDDRYSTAQWATFLKQHTYDLKNQPDKVFSV